MRRHLGASSPSSSPPSPSLPPPPYRLDVSPSTPHSTPSPLSTSTAAGSPPLRRRNQVTSDAVSPFSVSSLDSTSAATPTPPANFSLLLSFTRRPPSPVHTNDGVRVPSPAVLSRSRDDPCTADRRLIASQWCQLDAEHRLEVEALMAALTTSSADPALHAVLVSRLRLCEMTFATRRRRMIHDTTLLMQRSAHLHSLRLCVHHWRAAIQSRERRGRGRRRVEAVHGRAAATGGAAWGRRAVADVAARGAGGGRAEGAVRAAAEAVLSQSVERRTGALPCAVAPRPTPAPPSRPPRHPRAVLTLAAAVDGSAARAVARVTAGGVAAAGGEAVGEVDVRAVEAEVGDEGGVPAEGGGGDER